MGAGAAILLEQGHSKLDNEEEDESAEGMNRRATSKKGERRIV
jgi:hypothetical protein